MFVLYLAEALLGSQRRPFRVGSIINMGWRKKIGRLLTSKSAMVSSYPLHKYGIRMEKMILRVRLVLFV